MEEIDNEFLDYLGNMGRALGLSDLALKVFGVLFIEPEDVSLDYIAKKTGYSLASISLTMKLLENTGAVKRIRKPGSKKVFFFMGKDMVKWNIIKLDYANSAIIKGAKEKLPSIIAKYKVKAKTKKDKKKLKIIVDYFNQVIIFEGIIKKWRKDLECLMKQ